MSLALAVFGRKAKPQYNAAIIWGALVPDLSMAVLFAYELLRGYTPRQVFSEFYFAPLWQNTVSFFHSIPLYALLVLIGYITKRRGLVLFSFAALLHIAFDFPLHREDAHMHFWPLSDWKYISPVSYWDHRHYGGYWAPVELLIIVISTFIGMRVLFTKWGKIMFAVVMTVMAILQAVMLYNMMMGRGFD